MKIEMGESLFYSWLRHVKECQIVQTNWKTSQKWTLLHEDELNEIMSVTEAYFSDKYGYSVYKQTNSVSQLLQQAECDAIGICLHDGKTEIHAVDVAFHESGLQYGGRETTVAKIVRKCIRTAMCIYGYLDSKEAEIIFASPKIGKRLQEDLEPCMEEAQKLLEDMGFSFTFRLIGNEEFYSKVLQPILLSSDSIADTNELFMRSYQLLQMFPAEQENAEVFETNTMQKSNKETTEGPSENMAAYEEMKVGKLVNICVRQCLVSGMVTPDEIEQLQNREYSKKILHQVSFPVLVKRTGEYDLNRYYKDPLKVNGVEYMLCNMWSEREKVYVLQWLQEHTTKIGKRVQTEVRELLESGKIDAEELNNLQNKDYCKEQFGLNFSMLVKAGDEYNYKRYYTSPVTIGDDRYMICSQWYEKQRTVLEAWIQKYR